MFTNARNIQHIARNPYNGNKRMGYINLKEIGQMGVGFFYRIRRDAGGEGERRGPFWASGAGRLAPSLK